MTDDEVLARIGERARDEQKDDARLERVARGTASAEELAELERAAEADPELALRLEGSRPLEARTVDRIVASVNASPKPDPTVSAEAEKKRPGHELRTDRPNSGRAPLASSAAPFWKSRLVLAAGPLALAAAVLVYIAAARGPTGPELPPYSVTASGEEPMRGPATSSTRLHLTNARNARFELLLRPATAPQGKVVAYPFTFTGPGSEPVPLDAKVEIAPEGAVRLSGSSRLLEGVQEIRIVLGAPTAIGKFDDAAARAVSGTTDAHVRVLSVPIDRR